MSKLKSLLSAERLQPKISGELDERIRGMVEIQEEGLLEAEIQKVLDVLFDVDDLICFVINPQSPTLFKLKKSNYTNELATNFCINPMKDGKTRQTGDVVSFRNFLIEFDEMLVEDQLRQMEEIGFPFSIVTYSGNKSLHFIVSLEEPVESLSEYLTLSNWLQHIVEKFVGRADKQTRFPSAMTRFPNVTNFSTGKTQKVIRIGQRISQDELVKWLEPFHDLIPTKDYSKSDQREGLIDLVDWYIKDYLKSSYNGEKGFYECPLCKEDGLSNYGKKLMVTGERRSINCLHRNEHNATMIKTLVELRKNVRGGQHE